MMTVEQDGPRVAEYLIVAGLSETSRPLDEGLPNDSHLKASSTPSEPITDVAVILRGHGEKVPAGFTCIETTPTGFPADLSHGCIGSPNIFLCIKRGFDKPPLTDIGILYEGKERVMNGCEIISTTPTGHPANVNNSRIGVGGQRAYITYRRAQSTSPQNSLAVYDICVILANKGESPPHAFCKINKNLNKGAVVGSDVYMCYKKSAIKSDSVTFQPETLSRYPLEDHESFTLPDSVSRFCLPMGAVIECWSRERMHPLPVFSTFILTDSTGDKIYGAAVTFYETYPEESLTPQQKIALNIKQKKEDGYNIHTNKAVCLLSRWPFFEPFKKFLSFLYRLSISGPHVIPIERYIAHFIHEVPFPTTQRPRILVPLAHDKLILTQPRMTAIPLSGASFCALLRNLGPDNCMNLLVYALLEHKILLHSLRPALLTSVSEAVSKVIFPFVWQCPYIPLCPLTLCGVLCAPLPFIVGVDSRYFDSYEAPSDVTCIDIDTNSLLQCDDRKGQNWKILPKKPAKRLHAKLDSLYVELCQSNVWDGISDDLAVEIAPLDNDFSRKKKQAHMELCIQEAFLVFMASMLKGYQQYLLPITQQPNMRTMDATSRFDGPGFIKSRDKMSHAFFKQFIKTQMFMFFIEERSFVSHNDDIFNFFDECTRKVDSESREELKFLETEDSSQSSEHTVYVAPPEPVGNEDQKGYSYNVFPRLNDKYFNTSTATPLKRGRSTKSIPTSPVPRRTKQEIKSSLELAKKQASSPEEWAKCLMGNCYSIWFTHLPSYVKSSHSKTRALRTAFTVLKKMQAYNLTLADEVCYRVIMQLCGQYCQPVLAVQVFMEMKKNGITLNASTYGYYNKAVLESPWPTSSFTAYQQWIKLRNVIMAVAQFRQGLKRSNWDTVSETDTRSGSSVDVDIVIGDAKPEIQLIDIAGNLTREEKCGTGNSDMGYASMIESLGSTDLLGSPDATIVPVQMSSPASPSRSPHLMDKSPLEEDTTQTLRSMQSLNLSHDMEDFASRRNLAMDIRITSCNRCYQCNAMLYDEVIMAGWSADESNLNTKCFFCSSPNIVPFLFINIEDLRGKSDSCGALKRDNSAESMHSLQENTKSLDTHQKKAPSVPSIDNLLLEKFDEETNIEDSDSEKLINLDDDNLDTSRSDSALTVEVDKSLTQRQRSTSECKQADLVDMGQSLSSLKPFEDRNRRQLKSSTLPARTKNLTVQDEFFQASSLTSSHYGSKEYIPPPANKKKIEPISVPYLSPLVLRKEMENAIEHEGESCLRSPEFVEMHPIIFWNLIWYFRRLEIPTNLPGLILAAYSEGRETVEACNQYLHNDSRHIKLNLLWDNVELYNEIGVPMYILWNNRNSSLMKALITERQSFSKGFMLEVVKCIKSNDVQRPIEMMLEEFKKQQISKDKRRSIYREILFLAFVALKRENIDHDAFDVEYQIACSRLAAELKEDLQVHDKSPAVSIQRCRKIFGELFL
ncbi:C-myc promoter-binding protein-like isoform X4 [Anneissia japonica]|uniref:C-myc promoter-binding protein-like isoform X4 n=1 Tax=Anneissia japonica TaxID=1529436 RepID=UPI0014256AB6|nr:C-myc promoter-binding protein-like isoform X4 [Anneissia japonica]